MAKSKRAPRRAVKARAPRRARRASSTGMLGKMKWGEAIVMGVAGYLSGVALYKSGVAPYLYQTQPKFAEFVNATGAPNSGMASAKALGLVVGAKGIYDVFKGDKSKALNIELPFAIGAILDPKSEYAKTPSGQRW